ncbi:transcriptional regulator (plasmid) [Azospirillum sp. B510]|uniref:GntR family transcriptional regulator n=1 Tax=Azospirillum sp. (strain B510) TaxID=137722 RepID=UPI0001C4CC94|nr:transcriptional regulator [Azospirillum sp. B510]
MEQVNEKPAAEARPSLPSLLRLRDDTARPLYQQLEEQLLELIGNGSVPAGTTLPAERQLAESLGVSRTTVQRAYQMLRHRELISAHGRLGFIVRGDGPRLHPGMDRLKGFTEEMRELGRVPSADILEQRVVSDRSIASIFGLPSTAQFLKLVRVRRGDGIPMSRETAWYDLAAAPALPECDLSRSVYACLGERCGVPLTHCDQTIEATLPLPQECTVFGFSEPVACLLIKRRSYTATDRMIEYVEGLFRGDVYTYRLKLKV